MAGFSRLFLLKRVYTLYIGIFLLNVSFGQIISKDTILQGQFDSFVVVMENYVKPNDVKIYSGNDSLEEIWSSCNDYRLIWIKETNWPSYELKNGDSLNDLCSKIEHFKKVNGPKNPDESIYGNWDYDFTAIGKNYIIVEGDQAVGREVHHFYYYVRKDE